MSAGVTLPRGLGVALTLHEFAELQLSNPTQSSRYVVGRVQYALAAAPALTVTAGLGGGWHSGSDAPYENRGSGAVAALGVAVRLPAASIVGFTLSADYLQAVSGRREANTQRTPPTAAGPYRPRFLVVGLGLNFAAPAPK